jgi:lysozyme
MPSRSFLACLLLLTACSSDETVGQAMQAQTVCASGETVDGIDVSRWQENIDWPSVAAAGTKFAFTRAAYGSTKDTYFDGNWAGMAENGILRGAYQWFLPDEDPIAQAQFLLDVMGPLGPNDLPPVVDVEDTGGQPASTIIDKLSQWLQHVENAIGRKPIIYTGKYFWQDYVAGSNAFVGYPLWIPNYSQDCPDLPNETWPDWKFFQYTSTGSVPGVVGNVDRDLFNGTYEDLLAFAGGGYAAEFVSQSFPYAADPPLVVQAGEVIEAHIELKNVGTKTWNENTKLATSEPRDRASVFAGPEWPADNRLAVVEGEVPPGESFRFEFLLHAPSEPGTYSEYFSVVQEGEAWFSDPGQGGPPDDQLQGVFEVVPGPTHPRVTASISAEAEASCAVRRPAPSNRGWLLLLAIALLSWRRRAGMVVALLASACSVEAEETGATTVGSSQGGGGAPSEGTGATDPIDECSQATVPCEGTSECCGALVCDMTSLGQVCCGNEGESCATDNGEDCCRDLLCIDGKCGYHLDPGPCEAPCTQPPALILEKQRLATIGGSLLGICGDANHTYGYHVPAANLPSSDYSMEGSANTPVCEWHASAIDIGMDWPASREWLMWLIEQIQTDAIQGIAEVIGSYDGYDVRYWSDNTGWSDSGIPYTGSGHDSWTHVAIYRSTALDDHGILKGWTANSGP